jgi:hypothetical protein
MAMGMANQKGKDNFITSNVEVYAPMPINVACARLSSPMFKIALRLHAKIMFMPIRHNI